MKLTQWLFTHPETGFLGWLNRNFPALLFLLAFGLGVLVGLALISLIPVAK